MSTFHFACIKKICKEKKEFHYRFIFAKNLKYLEKQIITLHENLDFYVKNYGVTLQIGNVKELVLFQELQKAFQEGKRKFFTKFLCSTVLIFKAGHMIFQNFQF